MRRAALIIALFGWGTARAAPPTTPDERACKNLIDDARNLAAANKLAPAIAKLEACTAKIADEPTALGELGLLELRAKDLDKAEAATRHALASQGGPNLRGALFYNLALVLEARKDTAGEIAALGDSLRARPNATVRAKLRALAPDAMAAFDPYKPVAMAGPFKSTAAFCTSLPGSEKESFDPIVFTCACGTETQAVAFAAPAAYKHAQIIRRRCASDGGRDGSMGHADYHVAVETDAGWFVAPVGKVWFSRRCDNGPKFPVVALAGAQVRVEMTNEGECRADHAFSDRSLVVVGIGASAVPSATPAIMLRRHDEVFTRDSDRIVTGDLMVSIDVVLEAKWPADGVLELAGKTTGLDKATAADLVGKHVLAFP